ncbi:MAG: toll/interleukin-1 receptor domain-containing protein [Crocinitomicaceae bacterium]
MTIKEQLLEQKRQILNGGQVDVNLFKVRSLFKKYYVKEDEAESNYKLLIDSWNDNHGNYGAHDSLNKRQRVAGLLNVFIEDMSDETLPSTPSKAKPSQMKVFITHSSQDAQYGELLVELLRSLGLKESEIIFTSNVAYGIPVSQNIFNWLKSQISEKPFVIYLLSENYYQSVACLNEMGAAWVVENEHAALFTPEFDLSSKEYRNGALDPREIGFYINDEDRIHSFINSLSKNFDISNNRPLVFQAVKKFLKGVSGIESHISKKPKNEAINESSKSKAKVSNKKNKESAKPLIKGDLYSKFLGLIEADKLKVDEILLLHYMIDTSRIKLLTGWQLEDEILTIREWEEINDVKSILSKNYDGVLRRFEVRGFTEVSEVTSHGNPKEVKLKEEISSHILDLPEPALSKIDKVVKNNFHDHSTDTDTDEIDDFPF